MEDPLGRHYIIELYDCSHTVLDDMKTVRDTLMEAARIAGATIIGEKFHRFSPQGVSGVIVIAESHLSIHTWPELGYAALDLFTCSMDMDIQGALGLLRSSFAPGDMDVHYMERGVLNATKRRAPELLNFAPAAV
ncbi:MAG: adenosylmethionine decarboxylase [Spirochaetia bacterium]|nr:adenosylmethionine decarboxylase [Spirochaetia bacterium]